jgi:hypothetical protein
LGNLEIINATHGLTTEQSIVYFTKKESRMNRNQYLEMAKEFGVTGDPDGIVWLGVVMAQRMRKECENECNRIMADGSVAYKIGFNRACMEIKEAILNKDRPIGSAGSKYEEIDQERRAE